MRWALTRHSVFQWSDGRKGWSCQKLKIQQVQALVDHLYQAMTDHSDVEAHPT